jgi:putative FmdB family regulatory protein
MPLYEYQCTECNQVTEKLESYSEPSVKDCTACGGKSTAYRLIARTSFTLSGSGWYKDSYNKSK